LSSETLVQITTRTPPVIIHDRLQTGTPNTLEINVEALEAELRNNIKGEVRFSDPDRGMYANDASNYRMPPLGVVLPRDPDDVILTVDACREYGAPIFARGGGTSIPGQTVNFGVLLDFSKYMNRLLEMDPDDAFAVVEPGIVLDAVRDPAEKFHLTFGPDPATHSRCTIGGMIGNDSCGIHSVMAGRTSQNVHELEVLLYDGTRMTVGETSDDEYQRVLAAGGRKAEIFRKLRDLRDRHADAIRRNFPKIPRLVSGYNLPALLPENGFHVASALVGSECTCVLVLKAKLKLVYSPPARSLVVIGYTDIFHAADEVMFPMQFHPIALEGLDDTFIEDMRKKQMRPRSDILPAGNAWLLVEFGGGSKDEADEKAKKLIDELSKRKEPPATKLFDEKEEERLVWELREAGLGATAKIPGEPDNHEGWEDAAVRPEKVGAYLREFKTLLDKYGYYGSLYGHFGDGCVHTRLNFDLETAEGIQDYKNFIQEAADLVVKHGGSLSGEHGDGQARGELLPRMFDKEIIDAFREFKEIFDPDWKMNPGKLIAPYRVDENLRLGAHFNPPVPETQFSYPDDRYNFVLSTERCVGAGVCRREGGGVMCPSYMVTKEEKHSTRGRARLLGEMVRGETIHEGWQSEAVREALDLCLACKGCKGECPVQVDVAVYKSEFLSHYYEKHLRPRTAHTMGRIQDFARMASVVPGIVNFLSTRAPFSTLARSIAGIHPKREIPQFARQTFRSWSMKQNVPARDADVILWADTFNNYFHPQVAKAALSVLRHAGFKVHVPPRILCCGRPLYDWGMIDRAREHLVEILEVLREPIERGTPVVVLEPSCASVFHEELVNLFPHDENAKRLKEQTFLFAKFLMTKAPDLQISEIGKKALVHGHCHQKSIFKMADDKALLTKLGIDYDLPDTGCCGMAGAFGFEKEHYEISMQCAERVLLPAIRSTDPNAMIITDGFSCKEQIRQASGRESLHIAELTAMALEKDEI
jgi:FAD/FMN-containing dehydrogenase/Fe-S oxidoreductase